MSDNPYAPPGSQIGQFSTVQGQMAPPWQVVMAIRLAVVNFGIGFAVSMATWDHYLKSPWDILPNILVSLAVIVWIYHRIYLGRNWARITLLVVFLGGTIMLPFGYGSLMDWPLIEKMQSVVSLALNAMGLYFLFISPGRHWFRRPTGRDTFPLSPESSKPESGI